MPDDSSGDNPVYSGGLRENLRRLSASIYNFWHPNPSQREILESRVRGAYREARDEEKSGVISSLFDTYEVNPSSEGSGPDDYYRNFSRIREFMKTDEGKTYRQRIRALKSQKGDRMREIDLGVELGDISDKRRGRLYTSLQKLGPVIKAAGAVYSALNVAQRLYGLYVQQRELNRIRDIQDRASELPRPGEVYEMSPDQVENTMGRLERLEEQFEDLLPTIYHILKGMEEGSQETPKRASLLATAVILVLLSLGAFLVLRQTTTFALRVSQIEIPVLILGIVILGIISFVLFRRKK